MLRARLDNREGLLRPGMFARVRLVMAEREAIAVPEEALMPRPTVSSSSWFVMARR